VGVYEILALVVGALFRTADDVINQKIFEKSIDLILVTDRVGTFIRVSPSSFAILGYEPVEMVGRSGIEFIYHPDLDNTREMMRQQRLGNATRHFDCRYVKKDGSICILTWTGVWSGEEAQHFFIGRDITQARIAEQYKSIADELERMNLSLTNLEKRISSNGS